jgi:hypothetical protein
MSVAYKYKPDKHKTSTSTKTIDEMHKEIMCTFKKDTETLPEKKNELEKCEDELKKLESNEVEKNDSFALLKKKGVLKKKIRQMKREINDIVNLKKEMNYYGKAGDVVFDYYHLINGSLYNSIPTQKDDSNTINGDNECKREKIVISKELLAYSKMNKQNDNKKTTKKRKKKEEIKPQNNVINMLLGPDANKNDESDEVVSKATLENEYMMIINKNYACGKSKMSMIKKCTKCKIDKILISVESILCCPKCGGESEYLFIEPDVPSHKDTYSEKPKYPYKRIGHCIEKLNQFQSKGSTNVPPEVFEMLDEEIKKHGVVNTNVTMDFIHKMLKKHRYSNHYENMMYIFCQVTKTPPMSLTREEIEEVLEKFLTAEKIYFAKYKPEDRIIFLKYSFTLHKIFLTMKKPHHAEYFKLLKSPAKMKQHEKIWKNICKDTGWECS